MRLVKTHLHNTRYASCGTRVSSKIHLWSTTRMDVILHQNSSGRCWNRTVNPRLFQHVNHFNLPPTGTGLSNDSDTGCRSTGTIWSRRRSKDLMHRLDRIGQLYYTGRIFYL
jgi:hypothetical protein